MNITLDFTYDGVWSATGVIVHNEDSREIACILSSGGSTTIGYPSKDGDFASEKDYLYIGYFKHKGKNKMILIVTTAGKGKVKKTGEEYTFIKLEDTEAKTTESN